MIDDQSRAKLAIAGRLKNHKTPMPTVAEDGNNNNGNKDMHRSSELTLSKMIKLPTMADAFQFFGTYDDDNDNVLDAENEPTQSIPPSPGVSPAISPMIGPQLTDRELTIPEMDKMNDSNSPKSKQSRSRERDSAEPPDQGSRANTSRANTSTATLKVSTTDTPFTVTTQPSMIDDLPVFSGDAISNLSDDQNYMVIDFNAEMQWIHHQHDQEVLLKTPWNHRRALTPTPNVNEVERPKKRMAFISADDMTIGIRNPLHRDRDREESRGPFTYLFNDNGQIRVKLTLPLELPQSKILEENGSNVHNQMKQLWRKYIRNDSPFELNISHSVRTGLNDFFGSKEIHKLPKFKNYKLYNIMDECGSEILILMQDSLTRFLRSDLYKTCSQHIQVQSASMTSTGSPSDMEEKGVMRHASSYRDIRQKYGLLDEDEL